MVSNKCVKCKKEVKLVCCDECMWSLIMQRMAESLQGDIANRIKFMMDEKFEDLEIKIKTYFKDKHITTKRKGNISQ